MAADRPPSGPRRPAGLAVAGIAGSEMAGFTVLGVLLDLFVFDSMPWWTIGLTLFGVVAAFIHLVAMVKRKLGPTPQSGPTPPRGRP